MHHEVRSDEQRVGRKLLVVLLTPEAALIPHFFPVLDADADKGHRCLKP